MYEILADVKGVEKYSYSKLGTFGTCPYSYKLNYIDKTRGVGNGFSACGSLVHEILEKYLKNEILQFEMKDMFVNGMADKDIKVKLHMKGFTRDMTETYITQCSEFLDNFNGFEGLTVLSSEEGFNLLTKIKDKTVMFNGIIDVVAIDDKGDYYILDFKSKIFKKKEELKDYAKQMYLYSLWIKYKYGKFPKELKFVQFRTGNIATIEFNENELEESLEWAYNSLDNIENEQFFMPTCDDFFSRNLCNFRFICPYSAIVKEG